MPANAGKFDGGARVMQLLHKLTTKKRKQASTNLEEFIHQARELHSSVGINDFDAIFWPVEGRTLRSSGTKNENIWFTISSDGFRTNQEGFPEPFASFVRAVIQHRDARRPTGLKVSDHSGMLRACRYLFDAAKLRSVDPADLTPLDFNNAAAAAVRRELPKSAYQTGRKLEELGGTIDRHRLTAVTLNWVSPIPSPMENGGSKRSRIGPDFDKRREARLPGEKIIDALESISNKVLSPPDLLRQRAVELLCCGGFRITELLLITRDCWIEEQAHDGGKPLVDAEGRPVLRCGLRYFPAKDGHSISQIKWLPSVMNDIARRALLDITRITEPFAGLARYMYQNPESTILGRPWDNLDDNDLVSVADVGKLLLCTAERLESAGRDYCLKRSIPFIRKNIILKNGKPKKDQFTLHVKIGDIRKDLISRSSLTPVVRRDGSKHPLHTLLFVVPIGFFHQKRPALPGTVTNVTDSNMNYYLNGGGHVPSIFTRHEYRDEHGAELRVTSHQFRHWLGTLAQEGGLSQHEVARWMGRKRIKQNSSYDHVSGRQLARRVFEKINNGQSKGEIVRTASRLEPVRREEFLNSRLHTAHVTDLGICIFDWAMMPCPKHAACATCDDHLIEKGNAEQRQAAEQLYDETAAILANAEAEQAEGTYGVDNWLTHHRQTFERLGRILKTHADPSLQDGILIQLDGGGNATVLPEGEGYDASSKEKA